MEHLGCVLILSSKKLISEKANFSREKMFITSEYMCVLPSFSDLAAEYLLVLNYCYLLFPEISEMYEKDFIILTSPVC